MNWRSLLLLLTLSSAWAADISTPANTSSPSAASRPAGREALLFRNGDVLYGQLLSINPASGLRWRHSEAEKAIDFLPENVAEVHFPPGPPAGTNRAPNVRVQLLNHDELEGTITRLDKDKLVLETWYAGGIELPRDRVLSLVPLSTDGRVTYQGPTGLDGWTIGKVVSPLGDAGQWLYRNGAFYATNAASIARNVNLPDVASIEFDLAWKGLFQLAVAIYTDYFQPINLANKDTEPDFGGFYSLQLNSFSANLLPVKKNDPLRYLGQVAVPAFSQKNAVHVEIRTSKPKRMVALLIDGQLVKQWVDTDEFAGEGKGMRFVHQGQGKIKLSNLRISEWDGQFDEITPAHAPGSQDITRLRNGDRVTGAVDHIQDARVSVAAGGTKLDIPLTRVRQVEFAAGQPQVSSTAHINARAFFSRGGAVTFQLENWADGKVTGNSPNFGRLAFDAAAFSKVELRLAQP